ncbi:rhamnose mutarotase [Myriangium duriaei CBS 260.36]|uniref:Rhamnose mutarotase n=1 Tax=Myriangium duriaei CBS 260.36 TaxID=1168546 RepID=A0A9P4IV85_9PEZI|nr:rhamnose mutarotase [Myriangium duriaei CBS 260.36]
MSAVQSSPRRIGQIIRLKRSALAEYKEYHRKAWPEVLAQIRDSNIIDYSIFLNERTMTLFASMKYVGSDWEADMRRMKENPEVQRWWKIMDSFQESFNEGATGSTGELPWWMDLEEVFRVE